MNEFIARFTYNSKERLWYVDLFRSDKQIINTRAKTPQQALDRALITRLQMMETP